MKEFDLSKVENARIHELRDFARKIGVSSPTTLKKEELIEKIMGIVDGEDKPSYNIKKQGRPPKTQDELDFVSLLIPSKDEFEDTKDDLYNYNTNFSDFMFSVNSPQCEYNVENDKENIGAGLLDFHNSGYGIVRVCGYLPSYNDLYVSIPIIKKYNLKMGDYIEGNNKIIMPDKPKILSEITSINNGLWNEAVTDFDLLPYNEYKSTIKCDNNEFITGGRNLIFSNDCINKGEQIASTIRKSGKYSIKLLDVKCGPEVKSEKLDNFERIAISFNRNEKDIVHAVNLVVERAKREVEHGCNCVVILSGFAEIVKAYDMAFLGCYKPDEVSSFAINKVGNLLISSKYVDENHSLTFIVVEKKKLNVKLQEILNTQFYSIFNKLIDYEL